MIPRVVSRRFLRRLCGTPVRRIAAATSSKKPGPPPMSLRDRSQGERQGAKGLKCRTLARTIYHQTWLVDVHRKGHAKDRSPTLCVFGKFGSALIISLKNGALWLPGGPHRERRRKAFTSIGQSAHTQFGRQGEEN